MADTFTPEQITQILEEFFKVVGTRKYIGERYVPIFGRKGEESIQWDNSAPYEPLTIVLYQGNSYTSRQYVPIGVEITNQEFWVITGNYNAQVEAYHRETIAAREIADNAITTANAAREIADNAIITANNAQNDIDTLLPKADFSAENTIKKYIDENPTRILAFDTVADMQAATMLKSGMTCHTNGFHTSGDGGAAYYKVSASGTANGMDVLALHGGLFATLVVTEPYVTPTMFGAVGNNVADDTDILREVIHYSTSTGIQVLIPCGAKYYVTGSLNYYNETYENVRLNLCGVWANGASWEYALTECGGIRVPEGVNLFASATISGSIKNVVFVGVRNENVHFFHQCACTKLVMVGCLVSQFGAMFYDSGLQATSRIMGCKFLTVFYFARFDATPTSITDSEICHNYINGGTELTDNACFEWHYGNGSNISHNFIDFYNTIFRPKSNVGFSSQLPTSIGNQYQVFRYFYNKTTASSLTFMSLGDTFNHTYESFLPILSSYDSYTYTGRDGETYDTPSYIGRVYSASNIAIKDAHLESNVGNLIFLGAFEMNNYEHSSFEFTVAGSRIVLPFDHLAIARNEGSQQPVYNNGTTGIRDGKLITNIIRKADTLPNLSMGWSGTAIGEKVIYNNTVYTAHAIYDAGTSSWSAKWLDQFGNEAS